METICTFGASEFGRNMVRSPELGVWEAMGLGRGGSPVCGAKSGRKRKSKRLQWFVTP